MSCSVWATWSLEQVDLTPKPGIKGFGCETPSRCVAIGDTVLAGDRAAG